MALTIYYSYASINCYEGYFNINLQFVGKKRVDIAPKHKLSSNK
jgi:hypothetical protein